MRNPQQGDLFAPPEITRPASLPSGVVFTYAGRAMRIARTYGTAGNSAVIVEELAEFGTTLRGQYGLWSVDAVSRAISNTPFAAANRRPK
jgi:hypothetical protein